MDTVGTWVIWFCIAISLGLTGGLMWFSHRHFRNHPVSADDPVKPVLLFGYFLPLFTYMKIQWIRLMQGGQGIKSNLADAGSLPASKAGASKNTTAQLRLIPLAMEILVILLWSGYVGRELLDPNPNLWMTGQDFPLAIRDNYFWKDLLRCGGCALWNGRMNGGMPALIDVLDAPLHPLVALPAIFFGVIYGGRITVVLAMALAGLAQLWLGYVLRLGWLARLWAALMAVVAGTLLGRLELGLVTMVVSIASCSLIIPAGISFARHPTWRRAVVLSLTFALSILSGQGYAQLGVVLAILPALFILFARAWQPFCDLLLKLLVAGLAALLVCGVMLVPLANNSNSIEKVLDAELKHAQPIEYQPINLIVNNLGFYRTEVLDKPAAPFVFADYIGWIPILLALLALRLVPREQTRMLIFFLAGIFLVYLTSSLAFPRLLFDSLNHQFLTSLRHAPMIAGLVGPFILGLAAWGLDLGLSSDRLVLSIAWEKGKLENLSLSWFLLIPMATSVASAYAYNANYVGVMPMADGSSNPVVSLMVTTSAEWIQLPQNHAWNLYAFERDVKLTNAFTPWSFKGRSVPEGSIMGMEEDPAKPMVGVIARVDKMAFTYHAENEYAAIKTKDGVSITCSATAIGGWIDIQCPNSAGGELVVKEHNWSGWFATVDSQPAPIVNGEWLKLYLPTGEHSITFRYIPRDTLLGLMCSLVGLGLWATLWRKGRRSAPPGVAVSPDKEPAAANRG